VHDRINFKAGMAEGKAEGKIEGKIEEKKDNISKTIKILRDLATNEDIIAEKVEKEFEIGNEELKQFL